MLSNIGKMERIIVSKLNELLVPIHLVITNESYKHNVPPGSESHFHVLVVSAQFNEKNLLQRHRMVNGVLKEELKSVHALSILAKTPVEWDAMSNEDVAKSIKTPNCMGGGKNMTVAVSP